MELSTCFTQLHELQKEFVAPTHPEMCNPLVQEIYAENKNDVLKTKQYLQRYHLFWSIILQLHNQRSQAIKENNGETKRMFETIINNLVRERNHSLGFSRKLIFDLHGFTVKGALEYVSDIKSAIENSEARHRAITLITGHGERVNGAPTIKAEILRKFGENVQEEFLNPGRLTFRLQEAFMDSECFPDLGAHAYKPQFPENPLSKMSRRPLAQLDESSDQDQERRESIARRQEEQNTPNFDFGNIWVEIPQENLEDYDEEEGEEDEEDDDNETEISSATESEDDDDDDVEYSENEMEVDDDLEEQHQESRND
ncbi:hypothetical protein CRE_02555 [Caenorhabditis remanei]|uniref:Smr domain-containing protein n=1 Tax=Caenorhabditis remanei TaxID=31234 RepID=E3MWW6_CAERE|nr:hypothetical protein CRE_02555 [Caenorhabditis remanei]